MVRIASSFVRHGLVGVVLACLFGGAAGTAHAQAQVLTVDRWHVVQHARIGEVQMRPLARVGATETVATWRVDLRVPPRLGRFLERDDGHLDLLIEGGPPVAPSIALDEGAEGAPDTVRVSLSGPTVRYLAAADTARFVAGTVQIGVPPALRADLRRMLKKLPIPEEPPSGPPAPETDAGAGPSGTVYTTVDQQPRLIGGTAQLKAVLQRVSSVKEQGVEGRVLVEFVVDKRGRVHNPTVLRGRAPLRAAVERAFPQLHFEPGRQDGTPVNVKMQMPVTVRWDE